MSDNPAEVYRTTHPAALEMWTDYRSRFATWSADVQAFCLEHSGHEAAWYSNLLGRDHFDGLTVPDGDLPTGWRIERRVGMMVPDKRTPEGKEFARQMSALSDSPKLTLLGMPMDVRGPGDSSGRFRRYSCGVEEIGEALEVTWDVAVPSESVDFEIWVKVPLSQWHAEREAAQS